MNEASPVPASPVPASPVPASPFPASPVPDSGALLQQEFGDFAKLVHLHARERPDATAFIQRDSRWSYARLDGVMDQVAAALERDGIREGEAIAICAATSIEYAAVFLGALRAGVAVAPLSPSSRPESLAAMIGDCGARLVFLDGATEEVLADVLPATGPLRVRLDRSGGGHSFETWLAPAGEPPRPVTVAPDAPFNIIYSSGTTGTPKGIVQPHRMRWAQVQRAGAFLYGPEAVTLISTPLYSNTTLVAVFPTLAHGGAMVLMAKFEAREFLKLAERHRVTHAMLVPVQYRRIMALPDFASFDLSSFKMKSCTSAPFEAALKADVLERWPGGLAEVWGMTEGGGSTLLFAHEWPNKLHTIGRPSPGNDIRFIDDAGQEVAPGERGEIVGHSPAMMTGYHNQLRKTEEAEWHDATGKRFIRTGDIGRLDEDGFVVLMDRKKDMIISGGFNIYPGDLEAVLAEHEAVAEAAVIGVPSESWGETPLAVVALRPGRIATADEIRDFANARLSKMQRLAGVEIIDELPRSPIGKVLKRELRERRRG
ncbi:Acyl-CoA synthetase (AMP-forming)/AMP-acid ligase II [Rhizobiales bacterium GAS188]|nr:Acyl-CoA synthetase (AMP-forming)/AMP-acid ligase II [Rhizobiales bacterium GAS188]